MLQFEMHVFSPEADIARVFQVDCRAVADAMSTAQQFLALGKRVEVRSNGRLLGAVGRPSQEDTLLL